MTGIRITPAGAPLYVGAISPGIQVAQSGGAAPSPLLTDLVAYWKLDDLTWSDSVGSNDLTNNGSVTVGTPKVGAGSASFDATNYLSVTSTSFQTGNIDFTLACWIYPRSVSGIKGILNKYESVTDQREYQLFTSGTSVQFVVSSQGVIGFNSNVATPTSTISLNTWYFVVAWHDATAQTINIQVDNGTTYSASHSGGVFVGTSPFQVGTAVTDTFLWIGRIDEVALWKRLLTLSEISDLYNSGSGLSYPFS
jgi:hypothetical protein